jgi:hypothetical protein
MSTNVNNEAFGKAMNAALDGPEKKHVKFRNHDFHIRTITKTPNGNGMRVQGHMFHQLNNFPDDKILYSFEVLNGRSENLEIRFEKGIDKFVKHVKDAVELAGKVVQAVGSAGGDEKSDAAAPSGKIPRTEPAKGTEAILKDDGWKAESRFLIANIAFRVPRNA